MRGPWSFSGSPELRHSTNLQALVNTSFAKPGCKDGSGRIGKRRRNDTVSTWDYLPYFGYLDDHVDAWISRLLVRSTIDYRAEQVRLGTLTHPPHHSSHHHNEG